jgi:hypothetical protein
MAAEICNLGKLPNQEFADKLTQSIRLYPGNWDRAIKTINNWRTEISSLLGLIEYTDDGYSEPSTLAKSLNSNQDLLQFFRFFCFKFQYPGGHLKSHEAKELINAGVKFKPAKYIIELLTEGKKLTEGSFGIHKEELTHCVFNDLRVVRDQRTANDSAKLILNNRRNGFDYDRSGDIVRYAGDILDYMVLADILVYRPNGQYYLKTHELGVLATFTNSNEYFPGYEYLYSKPGEVTLNEIAETRLDWFKYVNTGINDKTFQTDIAELLRDETDESKENELIKTVLKRFEEKRQNSKNIRTKDIGDVGEAISIQHEKARLISLGRPEQAKNVKKIPEHYAIGYDISSYEGLDSLMRCIEVKTTVSRNKLSIFRFHMTPNEWSAAETYQNAYYIYRLMIYKNGITLFVIRNPVSLYKENRLNMTPRNGAEITYSDKSGSFEEVLA